MLFRSENSVTNYITIFGMSIDFLLIYATIISLYLDELEAGLICLLFGLFKDITIGGIFGINALIYFALGYVISYFSKKIYKESKVTIFTVVLITTIVSSLVNILASMVMYSSFTTIILMLKGIVALPILNSVASLLLYKLFEKSILKLKED